MHNPGRLANRSVSPRRSLLLAIAVTVGCQTSMVSVSSLEAQEVRYAKPAGRLFVFTSSSLDRDKLTGVGVVDLKSGMWSKVIDEGNPQTRVSPDGRFAASYLFNPQNPAETGVWLFDLRNEHEPKRVFETFGQARWSSDGKRLLITKIPLPPARLEFESWSIDVNGENRERLPFEKTDNVIDWAPDGRTVLISTYRDPKYAGSNPQYCPVEVMNVDGTGRRQVIEGYSPSDRGLIPTSPRIMPDGHRIMYTRYDPKAETYSLLVIGTDGKDPKVLIPSAKDEYPTSFCVAPDGKNLAVVFMKYELGKNGKPNRATAECQLAILDPQGQNRRDIPLPPSFAVLLDWRPAAE